MIKEVLGHADITSTQRYLHVGVDQGREALNETYRFDLSASARIGAISASIVRRQVRRAYNPARFQSRRFTFKPVGFIDVNFGRGERIRTSDPLLPKQMRYQAALRPDGIKTTVFISPGEL